MGKPVWLEKNQIPRAGQIYQDESGNNDDGDDDKGFDGDSSDSDGSDDESKLKQFFDKFKLNVVAVKVN